MRRLWLAFCTGIKSNHKTQARNRQADSSGERYSRGQARLSGSAEKTLWNQAAENKRRRPTRTRTGTLLTAYADTSFLISLYSLDLRSHPAAKLMRQAPPPTFITPLAELELINALQLRVFRREITPDKARAATDLFIGDVQARVFTLRALTVDIFERAKQIRERQHPLWARAVWICYMSPRRW
jgi:hypothetical protein